MMSFLKDAVSFHPVWIWKENASISAHMIAHPIFLLSLCWMAQGLDVSDIHRLENYLMDRLGRLQNESVLAVHLATPRSHALEDHSPATGVPPAMDPSRAKGSLPQIPMEQQTDSEVAMDQMDRAIHQADQMVSRSLRALLLFS